MRDKNPSFKICLRMNSACNKNASLWLEANRILLSAETGERMSLTVEATWVCSVISPSASD
jgi:hypothetical protein